MAVRESPANRAIVRSLIEFVLKEIASSRFFVVVADREAVVEIPADDELVWL
jgi:hypothetical protein